MTISLKTAPGAISGGHGPDGSIQLYAGGVPITLPPEEAVRLAKYITDSQPAPVEELPEPQAAEHTATDVESGLPVETGVKLDSEA